MKKLSKHMVRRCLGWGLCFAVLAFAVVSLTVVTGHETEADAYVGIVHPWLERLAWASDLAIAAAAVWALYHTSHQIGELQKANEASAHQARASFLLNLDERFESKELAEAQAELHRLHNRFRKEAAEQMPSADRSAREFEVRKKFALELRRLCDGAPDEYGLYRKLMGLIGFFDTVGLMVQKGYVKYEDIDNLLGGDVFVVDIAFTTHIEERQNEEGILPGTYKNSLYLIYRARKAAA